MNPLRDDLKTLLKFLVFYQSKKTKDFAKWFEKSKNYFVEILMLKRGKYQKNVWHGSILVLAAIAVLTSGVFGGNSAVASSFPGSGVEDPRFIQTYDPNASGISLNSLVNLKTSISSKPRSQIIDYTVKPGDTVSGIADKFGV